VQALVLSDHLASFKLFVTLESAMSKYRQMTNRELVATCLQDMTAAGWQEFVHRFQPVIAGVTARVVRMHDASATVIDDLIQDVYLKLCADAFRLLRECRLPHENSIFEYLKCVSASVAHDHFKSLRAGKRAADFNAEDIEEAENSQAMLPNNWSLAEEKRVLITEIDEVAHKVTSGRNQARDLLIFRLYYQEGLTTSEIAAIPVIKLSQKAVEMLLSRINSAIKKHLSNRKKAGIPSRA
jgi:RNA polymerase sigma-70 factor, ECF subfamily